LERVAERATIIPISIHDIVGNNKAAKPARTIFEGDMKGIILIAKQAINKPR
jgi:hypothetical protein